MSRDINVFNKFSDWERPWVNNIFAIQLALECNWKQLNNFLIVDKIHKNKHFTLNHIICYICKGIIWQIVRMNCKLIFYWSDGFKSRITEMKGINNIEMKRYGYVVTLAITDDNLMPHFHNRGRILLYSVSSSRHLLWIAAISRKARVPELILWFRYTQIIVKYTAKIRSSTCLSSRIGHGTFSADVSRRGISIRSLSLRTHLRVNEILLSLKSRASSISAGFYRFIRLWVICAREHVPISKPRNFIRIEMHL